MCLSLNSNLSTLLSYLWYRVVFSCPGSSIPDLGQWLGGCHFRILTQRVTFETWHHSDFWSEWCQDKKTKRQEYKKTNIQYCDVRAVSHSCDDFFQHNYLFQIWAWKQTKNQSILFFFSSSYRLGHKSQIERTKPASPNHIELSLVGQNIRKELTRPKIDPNMTKRLADCIYVSFAFILHTCRTISIMLSLSGSEGHNCGQFPQHIPQLYPDTWVEYG